MLCEFPDNPCIDRYQSHGVRKGSYCRLMEWKIKKGVCPYSKYIRSRAASARPRTNRKSAERMGNKELSEFK